MAPRKMLVDAIHSEETRVVVTSGSRIEEFDFESAARRQLRGNIYLAKVTRVEPSLQAAFVDYGGNRHGFLAFSEIHPDYYQIPQADRDALLAEEEEDEVVGAQSDDLSSADQPSILDIEEPADEPTGDEASPAQATKVETPSVASDEVETPKADLETAADKILEADADADADSTKSEEDEVEQVGAEDAMEEVPQRRRKKKAKTYKIQEVIKRRQVLLVQVVKEERGNKGAALTTYLSLAGRYSVLMPNTARGGGISRKITNAADRKRLKQVASELDVQKGMGVILRTAGASRTKAEVKRDFEYLLRLWENVRSLTLESSAPCLVYEEGSLIKRSIRDLYNKDIDEVQVSGEEAYREAKDFMRMIMPSHAKNVQPYREEQPIFSRHGVEQQLDSMFSPQVTLPSGGYLVINPTEALVSVDVNSGKATKEHNIEDTALQTNLEAAAELARQLRLRDMAGLVVIDFIDMEEKRNIRAVERKLKDSLKTDRARIQVGRISHFGLLEMSRQRIRFGVLESSTITCPVCTGTGLVRSVDSLALMVMRAIEDQVMRKQGQSINVKVPTEVALYLLNAKRSQLLVLEQRFGLAIAITAENHLLGDQFTIEKGDPYETSVARQTNHVKVDSAPILAEIEEDDVVVEDEVEEVEAEATTEQEDDRSNRRRGKRRRRGGRDRDRNNQTTEVAASDEDKPAAAENGDDEDGDDDQPKKRRRRGRRGGRRNRRVQEDGVTATNDGETASEEASGPSEGTQAPAMDAEAAAAIESAPSVSEAAPEAETADEKPKKRTRRPRRKKTDEQSEVVAQEGAEVAQTPEASKPEAVEATEEKPKRRRGRKSNAEKAAEALAAENAAKAAEEKPAKAEPKEEKPAEVAPIEVKTEEKPSKRPERAEKKLPEEGIIVTSSSPAKSEEDTPAEPEKKVKKGWWQRNILGN
ncbi:Rne/Rng family ribonuclease [Maritalea porphyrae]|uniref:Rne/Rng family ribonuclease n=1 Tax=Maritalea porphyrae TaxID=880732 RepID=UPI0022AF1B30|nr:ribonuclease E/G [Maritalea porphyrae]MCZ4272968.1 ribonuclease E/G [Maritalea porphyrae]